MLEKRHSTLMLLLLALVASLTSCTSTDEPDQGAAQIDNEKFEGDADYFHENAERYYDKGDYVRALTQFDRWLEKEPTSWGAALGKAFCHYNIGRNLAAQNRFDDANDQFRAAETQFTQQWDGTYEDSADTPGAHQWRAAFGLALTERALANLDTIHLDLLAARALSDRPEVVRQAKEEEVRVSNHRKQYYEKSLAKFERLSQVKNPPPDVWLNLGDLQFAYLEETKRAERSYLTYLDLAKRSVQFWDETRRAAPEKYTEPKALEEAIAIIDSKQAAATEKTLGVLMQMARIKYVNEDYPASLAYLQDARNLDPERSALHLNVAECYHKLKNDKKALEHVDMFIKTTNGAGKDVRRAYELRTEILARSSPK